MYLTMSSELHYFLCSVFGYRSENPTAWPLRIVSVPCDITNLTHDIDFNLRSILRCLFRQMICPDNTCFISLFFDLSTRFPSLLLCIPYKKMHNLFNGLFRHSLHHCSFDIVIGFVLSKNIVILVLLAWILIVYCFGCRRRQHPNILYCETIP